MQPRVDRRIALVDCRENARRNESRRTAGNPSIHSRLRLSLPESAGWATPSPLYFRRARGQGNIRFLCSADHEQDWQPYPVDPYSAICDDHAYIHI